MPGQDFSRSTRQNGPSAVYGSVLVVVAAGLMSATLPGRTHGVGLIAVPLISDSRFGLTELGFDQMNFWAVILGALLCIPAGRLIDRWGIRLASVLVTAGLGLATWGMSRAADAFGLFLLLTLVRGLGQGALSVVSLAVIGKWFTQRLSTAMGVFSVLLAIGFIAGTLLLGDAIKAHGWRSAWGNMGLLVGLGAIPCALLLRNASEREDPHGRITGSADRFEPPDAAERMRSAPGAINDWAVGKAVRSPAFWVFTLSTALFNLVWSAITLLSERLLAERGFDHETYVAMMSILVGTGMPANLVAGWLARSWPLGKLLAAGMLLLAIALGMFPWVSTPREALAYGAVLGVAGGVITVVFFALYGAGYGRANLGVIQASGQVVNVLASASGPVLLTLSTQSTGASVVFFATTSGTAVLAAAILWSTRLPRERTG